MFIVFRIWRTLPFNDGLLVLLARATGCQLEAATRSNRLPPHPSRPLVNLPAAPRGLSIESILTFRRLGSVVHCLGNCAHFCSARPTVVVGGPLFFLIFLFFNSSVLIPNASCAQISRRGLLKGILQRTISRLAINRSNLGACVSSTTVCVSAIARRTHVVGGGWSPCSIKKSHDALDK